MKKEKTFSVDNL